MSVEQSGNITPGHLAKFITSGVIGDAGPLGASQKVLAYQQAANFNVTTDQPLILPITITAFQLTGIIVANASISLTTAQGGFYTAASKGGSVIVLASQAYSALTNANLLMQPTLTAFALTARFSANNLTNNEIYFALTAAQGAPATADIYLVGIDLSIGS